MISNIRKNIMGTVSFSGKFDGMRMAQDFIVYPMRETSRAIKIQSDTRIGLVDLETGAVMLSPSRTGGSYGVHLAFARPAGVLSGELLLMLKAQIASTASPMAGDNAARVFCDNSAAITVLEA